MNLIQFTKFRIQSAFPFPKGTLIFKSVRTKCVTLRPRLPICGCRLSCRRLWAPGWGRSCPSGRARGQKAAAETRGPHIPTSPRATSPGRDPVSSVVRKHCSKKLNSLV